MVPLPYYRSLAWPTATPRPNPEALMSTRFEFNLHGNRISSSVKLPLTFATPSGPLCAARHAIAHPVYGNALFCQQGSHAVVAIAQQRQQQVRRFDGAGAQPIGRIDRQN